MTPRAEQSMIPETRIGVSTLTWLSKPAEWGIRRAAEMGFRWVDIGIIQRMTGLGPARLADELDTTVARWDEALRETGIGVATFNANISLDTNEQDKRHQATALCEAAKRLNVQHGITLNNGPADNMTPTVAHLEPILEVFGAHHQTPMVESHRGNWTERPDQTMRLLEALPGLKVTLDAAHYIAMGFAPDDWQALLPHVRHCHVRPAARDTVYTRTDERAAAFDHWLGRMAAWAQSDDAGCLTYELIERKGIDADAETLYLHETLRRAGLIG